ncbi:hypothetical protein P7C73_g2862, partial [Tremellales sp. Uapishka_1]
MRGSRYALKNAAFAAGRAAGPRTPHASDDMDKDGKIKALLIDLNGTVVQGNEALPGSLKALERLREARVPHIFCSNTTKESSASLLAKIRSAGIQAQEADLLSSLSASQPCTRLSAYHHRPLLLLSPSGKEEFAHLAPETPDTIYDSVVIGLHDEALSYPALNKAFRVLKGEPIASSPITKATVKKPILLAPHASLFHQSSATDSLPAGLSLGPGPFIRGLEEATGVKAEIVGKPTKRFFELGIEKMRGLYGDVEFGIADVGVVGDDVTNDFGAGADELGLRKLLVKTGKYRAGVEEGKGMDGMYESFAAFVDELLDGK